MVRGECARWKNICLYMTAFELEFRSWYVTSSSLHRAFTVKMPAELRSLTGAGLVSYVV